METGKITQKAIPGWEEEEADGGTEGPTEGRVQGFREGSEARSLHGADFFISTTWSHARAFHKFRSSWGFLPSPHSPFCKLKKKRHNGVSPTLACTPLRWKFSLQKNDKLLLVLESHRPTFRLSLSYLVRVKALKLSLCSGLLPPQCVQLVALGCG